MKKTSMCFILLFALIQTTNCFGQLVIFHVTLHNTDSTLNSILLERQVSNSYHRFYETRNSLTLLPHLS